MGIKRTQGELKRQRDALKQYERYLPTLQLKKQLLQMEILHQQAALREKEASLSARKKAAEEWAGLLVEAPGIRQWLVPMAISIGRKNVAGVDLPVFQRVEFGPAEYDLFLSPLWVDGGIEALREMISLQEEIRVTGQGLAVLRQELRITTQRVNLFEKVKIPGAKEAIRLIRIHIGDQMTAAVGRSKIAKDKIRRATGEKVPV
jgi:V/A-type H+-transporting ATPase subunit D